MNITTAPAWLKTADAPVAEAAPAPATPVTPEPVEVLPAKLVAPYRSSLPPRTVEYELDMAQHRPVPATLPDDERAELVSQRDALGAKLLDAEAKLNALDVEPLPDDLDAALAESARRDDARLVLGKALGMIAERLRPLVDALAKDDAAHDQIAADAAHLLKLKLAAAYISRFNEMAFNLETQAGAFHSAATTPGTNMAGVGALPSVHFAMQEIVARIGGAMRLLGGVR